MTAIDAKPKLEIHRSVLPIAGTTDAMVVETYGARSSKDTVAFIDAARVLYELGVEHRARLIAIGPRHVVDDDARPTRFGIDPAIRARIVVQIAATLMSGHLDLVDESVDAAESLVDRIVDAVRVIDP